MDRRYNEAVVNFLLGLFMIVINILTICNAADTFFLIMGIILLVMGAAICVIYGSTLIAVYVDRKIDEYLKITEQMENFDE